MDLIDPNDEEARLLRRLAEVRAAKLQGTGAIAQGGDALAQQAVKTEDNSGTIITGTQIVIHYHEAQPAQGKADIARQVAGYLNWLKARTASIELRGIERAGGAPVVLLPLETAYVPLRARALSRLGDGRWDSQQGGAGRDIALNEALGLGQRLAIIGGPGSGKTTVLLHMAWALAASLLAQSEEPARPRLGLNLPPAQLPLPLFVPLASFARHRRSLPAQARPQEKTLAHFITHHLISKQADFDLPADFFVHLLKEGRDVILLLDGLDEVANEDERAAVRQSVEELVSGREALRVVVTCRTIAYSGRTALGADFREIAVRPLERERHIAPMVAQAYACIYPQDAAQRDFKAQDLLRGIDRLEDERKTRLGKDAPTLVDSPLLVRLLLIVHFNNRTLPDERAELFDKAINALLQVDYGFEEEDIRELKQDWKPFRDMAQFLAFHMHNQGRDQGREIEEAALKAVLKREFQPQLEAFLAHARQRGSVLEERGGGYRFIHLAFQEFLVARYLREEVGDEERNTILAERLDDPWWREPILLLAGYWATNAASSARKFIANLAQMGGSADRRFAAAELAGMAALEWKEAGAELRAHCAEQIVALLEDAEALVGSELRLRVRAVNRLLGLGDPRFDPGFYYLPKTRPGLDKGYGFVRIEADSEFMIGTRSADRQKVKAATGWEPESQEINDQITPTPEFFIARYPVTAAQFRRFVEASGFQPGNPDALRDPGNRPVRWVSWHEALAYCDWLHEVLQDAPGFALAEALRRGDLRVTLPSELEWEKAARGGRVGAVFPWGDKADPQRANTHETRLGGTFAVGCFPANGYGLSDMAGNVWEWTHSVWGRDYPYAADDADRERPDADNKDTMVVRGGSWDDLQDCARCAYRRRFQPVYRYDLLGFRVVLSSSPVRCLGPR